MNLKLFRFARAKISSRCKTSIKFSFIGISLVLLLLLNSCAGLLYPVASFAQEIEQISLTALLVEPRDRWDILVTDALKVLQERHPDLDININYTVLPYGSSGEVRGVIQDILEKKISVDIISVDQIWLADFAEKGLLSDLTNRTEKWGRLSDWYQANLDGMLYEDKIYGIWVWTDQRMVWYWKDLLQQANIDPTSLNTWNGFIAAAKKINDMLKDNGIEGVQLICGGAEWYPYLWMQGGDILEQKPDHPTKGSYWFPTFNGTEGLKALEFFKDIIDAGITPQTQNFESNFANRKFVIYIGGSWIPASFPNYGLQEFEERIGMNPGYPVPNMTNQTTTVMGGWELSIPETSKNKDLAWELITIMSSPDTLTNMLNQTGYLPTQTPIGEGQYAVRVNSSIPYYDEMISMIPLAKSRPVIPEFPEIDLYISQELSNVCKGIKEPKQALNDAAVKSAQLLGW
jgi:multiple sugar transport system substrate-binding protein